MSTSRPPWVADDLMSILGLDDETVKQIIIPDLEGYTNETRLRGHLQDFLGSSNQAKTFSTRYLSLRFPSIAPLKFQPTSSLKSESKIKTPISKTPNSQTNPGGSSIPDALNEAFGPGGKLYQKNRDDVSWGQKITPTGSGSHTPGVPIGGSASASGSGHPRQSQRMAGGLVIHEAKKSGAKVDADVLSNGGITTGSGGKGKEKEKEKIWDLPKSKEVKKLEGIIEELKILQSGEAKSSSEEGSLECFCQARLHPLSPYTPQCASCGLIQCHLQPPHMPCRSCHNPLLTPPQISRLIMRLHADIESQLEFEQSKRDERERERLERLRAEAGGGAFPVLNPGPGGQSGSNDTKTTSEPGRKVLTLGGGGRGKSKAVLTTTYSRPPPVSGTTTPQASPSSASPPIETVGRPRSPPPEPKKVQKDWEKTMSFRTDNDRPWGNLKMTDENWAYVESAVVEVVADGGGGRRRNAKKKRGGGVGMDGRVVVGAV